MIESLSEIFAIVITYYFGQILFSDYILLWEVPKPENISFTFMRFTNNAVRGGQGFFFYKKLDFLVWLSFGHLKTVVVVTCPDLKNNT